MTAANVFRSDQFCAPTRPPSQRPRIVQADPRTLITPHEFWSVFLEQAERRHRTCTWLTHQPDDSEAGERMRGGGGRQMYEIERAYQSRIRAICQRAIAENWEPRRDCAGMLLSACQRKAGGDMHGYWSLLSQIEARTFRVALNEHRMRQSAARKAKDLKLKSPTR